MEIYCLPEFLIEFKKLKSKKPYRSLEKDIITYFFDPKKTESLHFQSGTNLNNSITTPYIKKRLNGSGGYRFYFLLLIKDEKIYLLFVHPKSGPDGAENITDESKAELYKKVLLAIESENYLKVSCDKERNQLTFSPLLEINKIETPDEQPPRNNR